jgi:thiamine-phosphate pyrophosphorylase
LLNSRIDFRLIAITNQAICKDNFLKRLSLLSELGIRAIQLREKQLTTNKLFTLAKKVKQAINIRNTKLFINDRLDIALLVKADGIHSPSYGINCKYIKPISTKLINGKSVHTLKEAIKAEKDGFDYILFGPVFETPGKGEPKGLKMLNKICLSVKIPVFAVGGIEPKNARSCIESGAYGAAAIRPFMTGKNVKFIAEEFHNALGGF